MALLKVVSSIVYFLIGLQNKTIASLTRVDPRVDPRKGEPS